MYIKLLAAWMIICSFYLKAIFYPSGTFLCSAFLSILVVINPNDEFVKDLYAWKIGDFSNVANRWLGVCRLC